MSCELGLPSAGSMLIFSVSFQITRRNCLDRPWHRTRAYVFTRRTTSGCVVLRTNLCLPIAVHMELCSIFSRHGCKSRRSTARSCSTLLLGRISPLGWKATSCSLPGRLQTITAKHALMRTRNIAQGMTVWKQVQSSRSSSGSSYKLELA